MSSAFALSSAGGEAAEDGKAEAVHPFIHSSKSPRPSHSSLPPSLNDLPWPLPLAPELHRYTLTVPRPVFVAPPPYSEDVNEENGEATLMSGEAPSYH